MISVQNEKEYKVLTQLYDGEDTTEGGLDLD